jgi:RNA polymerase sigma-70 factor (ECF subfamily)
MEWTDEAAVAQAKNGDADAFRVLAERHGRSAFRLAYRMTGNEQDAEDIAQESLLRAYRQIHTLDGRASFRTWFYRIVTNCSLDLLRKSERRHQMASRPADADAEDPVTLLPSHEPGPDRVAMSNEVRERLSAAMGELSPAERSAFVLRHFEGMAFEDLSRLLGCRPGAARHSVFRAVQKLRRALEPLASGTR